MRQIARIAGTVDTWRDLERRVSDLTTLIELSIAEDDRSLEAEITDESQTIERTIEELEFQLKW